jgi:integrase/recombinase XerD
VVVAAIDADTVGISPGAGPVPATGEAVSLPELVGRAVAVEKLRLGDFQHDVAQYVLRLQEKGGKSRKIPVRHDLEGIILGYVDAAGIAGDGKDKPLFRASSGRTQKHTGNVMTSKRICELVKRRLRDAGLPLRLSPHLFRATAITDLLSQGIPLEDVQYLAGHAEPRTTGLYDRRQKKVTRNIGEDFDLIGTGTSSRSGCQTANQFVV